MVNNPKIRGIVEIRTDRPVSTISRTKLVPISSSIRIGSVVTYNCQDYIVEDVNFGYSGFDTIQVPGSRIVRSVNLTGIVGNVPLDQLTVIKF